MDKNDIAKVFLQMQRIPPRIILYDDLNKFMPCIFLYRGYKVGHWCAILKHSDSWEIFDPIGLFPDTELNHPAIIKMPDKLVHLGRATNARIFYNHLKLQQGGRSCGLWCIFRFLHSDLTYNQFARRYGHLTDLDICKMFGRMDLLN